MVPACLAQMAEMKVMVYHGDSPPAAFPTDITLDCDVNCEGRQDRSFVDKVGFLLSLRQRRQVVI